MYLSELHLAFDILGIIAFSVSGALVAVRKRMDIFGVIVLSIATAAGGGVMRDILIGNLPVEALLRPHYVVIAGVIGLVFFTVIFFQPRFPDKLISAYDMIMFCFDTLGVASFTVQGVAAAAVCGYRNNLFLLVFVGSITGVGGGMLRDILANRVPEVLRKHVYALAVIPGALIAGVFAGYEPFDQAGMIVGFLVIVLLRLLAAAFHWNLPKVKHTSVMNR